MERVTLTGPAETLLATLHGRVLDARSAHPVLADRWAVEMAARLDYDWSRPGMRPSDAVGVAMRAKVFDRWTREFLAAHPRALVLHLACGLDSRVERVDPGPDVEWVDLDQPDVIALRERLVEPRPGYRMVGASVLDDGWLDDLPRDRPVLVVAEGLTMYLPRAEGPPLLRRLVAHLGRGELAFDTYSPLGVRLSQLVPAIRRTGNRLDWGIGDPHELEREVPGLRLLEALGAFETAEPADLVRQPRRFRRQVAVMSRLPVLRDIGHVLRFAFGG